MKPNYYKKTLGHWKGFNEQANWLQKRCDSSLEVMSALAFLGYVQELAGEWSFVDIYDDCIRISDPHVISPTGNGASVSFLTCQNKDVHKWDFCIHTAYDNGHMLDKAKPTMLIDIDGFGIHKNQRSWDIDKLNESKINSIRICEERFLDLHQIGRAIAWSSIFADLCENHEKDDCEYCNDLSNRIIWKNTKTALH